MSMSSAPAPQMMRMNSSVSNASFSRTSNGIFSKEKITSDEGIQNPEISNSLELSDKDLQKQIQKDTILYSSLGESLFEEGMLFKLPNRVGKFRVTVVGVSKSGVYGMYQSDFQVQRPFNASIDTPLFIRGDDQLTLTLTVENNTK